MFSSILLLAPLFLVLCLLNQGEAKRPSSHPHRGNGLAPYSPGSVNYELSAGEEAKLSKNEAVFVQIPDPVNPSNGKAICVQVRATRAGRKELGEAKRATSEEMCRAKSLVTIGGKRNPKR